MTNFALMRAAFVVAALSVGTTASAAVLDFSGSFSGLASVAPDASCAPLAFRGTISSATTVGHSSLGDFTYSHSICLAGGVGTVAGSFLIDFGQDSFQGTLDGLASASGTPGLFDETFNYTILSGTGRFLDAAGTFSGIGTVDTRIPPPHVNLAFEGEVNVPAVPEPGTWALMLLGYGAVGVALRRRKDSVQRLRQLV